ncbi:hypothetical protein KQX54_007207 [Cotesia glomerata]|uniref:Uncharacterized protein n=1 Tax=Cotesia glomerata TaxID=32391 RepID=A0AAV7I4S9_COTGL|nr:hypothetical protein KQX54_007207 [Cotesia glomerata]
MKRSALSSEFAGNAKRITTLHLTSTARSICSQNSAKYKRGLVYRKNPSNDPYKISLSRMLFAQRISNRENSCDFMTSHYAPVSLKNGPQNGTSSSFLVPHINRCLRRDKQCSVFCPRHNAGSHTTHYTHDTSLSQNRHKQLDLNYYTPVLILISIYPKCFENRVD